MQKITIVGAGRVGESTGQFLAKQNLCRELVLMDINEGAAKGCALDIQETAPIFEFDITITGATNPISMKDSELVIITAGIPRKPGMSRSDVLDTNINILNSIVDQVVEYAPDSKLLVVSNPVDILTYQAWKRTGWDRSRVMGQAGVLDSARMAAFISMETNISVKNINTMVLGGHGDAMVPMTRFTTVSGIPIKHFLDQATIDRIVQRSRFGGAEILGLRKNSSAYDAPAAAITQMVEAIARERNQILPTVTILEGEYGETDIAMGVPCILGQNGMQQVIDLPLTDEEQQMFTHTVDGIRKDIARLR
ncbi:MAG: malate dehydrogenase [bacterium]